MTPHQVITDFVNEWREKRKAATQGEWDTVPATEEWKLNKKNNADFMRFAANNSDKAMQAIEMLSEALEFYSAMRHPVYQEKARQTLSEVSRILGDR